MTSVTISPPDLTGKFSSHAIDSEFSGLIDDIIMSTIEGNPTRFFDAHNVPVDGAEQSFIAFDFNWPGFALALEANLLSALRAVRLEAPRGNDILCHDSALPDHGSMC
jgi:hypothetical protein